MARPKKSGLDYFPLDVDFFENEKIEAISGEFGIKGELAAIKLLCAVYEKGYFIVWNDLFKMKLLKRLPGVSSELLDQIVERLVKWNFFNEDLFNSSGVLTSLNIQKTYLEATKRRKNNVKLKFNVVNADINSSSDVVNVDINAQSKVKESKVNKSKTNIDPKQGTTFEERFVKLWAIYPNKRNYGKAKEAYERAVTLGATDDEIKSGIENYKKFIELNNIQLGYVKAASSWFEGSCWKDELDLSKPQKQDKTRVKETLPDFAQDDYVPNDEPPTSTEIAALQAQMEVMRGAKPE